MQLSTSERQPRASPIPSMVNMYITISLITPRIPLWSYTIQIHFSTRDPEHRAVSRNPFPSLFSTHSKSQIPDPFRETPTPSLYYSLTSRKVRGPYIGFLTFEYIHLLTIQLVKLGLNWSWEQTSQNCSHQVTETKQRCIIPNVSSSSRWPVIPGTDIHV